MTRTVAKPTSGPPIIVTPGDPAGIGAEISLKAFAAGLRGFVLMEDPERLARLADDMGLTVSLREVDTTGGMVATGDALPVLPFQWEAFPVPGTGNPKNGALVVDAIRRAVALARSGLAAAVVTNPINKAVLNAAGFPHPGHTEFLATLSATRPGAPTMMLASDELRVVPVTVHMALNDVPKALNSDEIFSKGVLLAESLRRDFGYADPRIAVCGLNPHAGEDGQFGDEDHLIVAPAVEQLRSADIAAFGPLSADTLFHAKARKSYDGVLGMYHDQVLIPIKTIDFDGGVNVTLGLDFIRTSPDHGTAFDIAGTGKANPASLMAALRMARSMANTRHASA